MILILSTGLLAVFLAAYLAKQNVDQAYQDCRDHSEIIRQAVINYKSFFGDYPESLEQLKIKLCGQLILHKPLLNYKKTESDFELWYSDSFILYRGDSLNPMDAKK